MKRIKNATISLVADKWGNISANVSKHNKKHQLEWVGSYKFAPFLEGVELKIYVPKDCRSEYAELIFKK